MHSQIHGEQNEADDFSEKLVCRISHLSGLTEGKCFHAAVIVLLFCLGVLNGDLLVWVIVWMCADVFTLVSKNLFEILLLFFLMNLLETLFGKD